MAEDVSDSPTTDVTLRTLGEGQVVFGRYRLGGVLGQGGMGIVWRAHDQELSRDVALKFVPETLVHDEEAIADLKRETSRCLELTHPHIVRIYDIAHDTQRFAISMEVVDGGSLSSLKVHDPARCLPISRLAPLLLQLLEGLEYAHDVARIIHRDLKPANLMITSGGRLKIADFGIASTISDSVSRVSLKPSSGTLPFMSPQQAFGGMPTPTDDLYSFGATVYDLVTGKPPFFSGNILHQLEHLTAPSMAQRRAELGRSGEPIPAVWEEAIAACLAKDAAQRPPSAAALRERLGGLSATRPTPPGPPPLIPPIPHPEPVSEPTSQRSAFTPTLTFAPPPLPNAPAVSPGKSKAPLLVGLAVAAVVIALVLAFLPHNRRHTWVTDVSPPASDFNPAESDASAQPGRIVVNTLPSGAHVVLDNEDRGLSPLLLESIPPGTHRLALSHEGYESSELVLEVAPGQTTEPGTLALVASTPTATAIATYHPPVQSNYIAPPEPPPQTYGSPWLFPDSSSRRLTRANLAGLGSDQLYRARNEIYARHGLMFSTPRGRAFAATLGGWYRPTDANQDRVYARMSALEQANVELIRSLEAGR